MGNRAELVKGEPMLPGHLCRPAPRRQSLAIRLLRGLWTLPTNLIGHLAGRLLSGRAGRRVGGPAAVGWLYPIRSGIGLDWVGAVTIGHAILHRPGLLGTGTLTARLTLAHELAHTRQHDLLGPFYLPLHILAQATSTLLSVGRPVALSRVHDGNPLEQTFIAVSASETRGTEPSDELEALLADFGASSLRTR